MFMRESLKGSYGTVAYFLSKSIVDVPSTVLSTLAFACIVYYPMGLQQSFEHFLRSFACFCFGSLKVRFHYLNSTILIEF
jgi:ABC-type multidrug transport system permease subunit